MAQGSEFPLRKPPGFHWDFFLLGVTTFIAGLIGLPAPNGLIPQAPIHTTSLLIMGRDPRQTKDEEDGQHNEEKRKSRAPSPTLSNRSRESSSGGPAPRDIEPPKDIDSASRNSFYAEVPVGVVEQRVSNLAQGSLCLILLTGPFLHVLHLIPRGVLAGLLYVL
jgi:hypothetical protein